MVKYETTPKVDIIIQSWHNHIVHSRANCKWYTPLNCVINWSYVNGVTMDCDTTQTIQCCTIDATLHSVTHDIESTKFLGIMVDSK